MTSPAAHPPWPPLPPHPALARAAARQARQAARTRWSRRRDVRVGALFVVVLAVLGAALGPAWAQWSPARPPGGVIGPHLIQPLGESESFIASDGRYGLITLGLGLIAGIVAWLVRSARGPVLATALALGALAGGLLTEFVGHRVGGGRDHGAVDALIPHLPLSVHMHALRVVEPLAAVLVYAICAAFAGPDDLGVPGAEPATEPASVGVDREA